jgi:peptidoglycan/LPS O-acetylase OafA/YrhL
MNQSPAGLNSKPHYAILDGLRGVAAIIVVAFHLLEAHATNAFTQIINHGYLAVDFFFLLSGFVVGYAYDDRWGKMSSWNFFKRRLIRLHPMVVLGSLIGAVCFYFGASTVFPLIHDTPVWKMLAVMLVGCTLIPILPSMDIRGWQEMHPLNGPAWSLFFEYVANILYALVVRKFSRTLLALFVMIAGGVLLHFALTSHEGDFIGGWTVDGPQLRIGFTRMMYPFFAGLLLFRMGKLIRIKHAFWVCSGLIAIILAMPRIGGPDHVWMNGLYEAFCIIVLFPLIVALGAGGSLHGKYSTRICGFLGDISYPIYITHYPLIYLYTAWVGDKHLSLAQSYPGALLVFFGSFALAYACLKLYDEPARNWLKRRFLMEPKAIRSVRQ